MARKIIDTPRYSKKTWHNKNDVDWVDYDKRNRKSWTLNLIKPGDQKAYWFYRRNRKTDNKIGENRSNFRQCVGAYFKAISELITEYEGGVLASKYGYFTPIVLPWVKRGINTMYYKDPLFHTEGKFYTLTFFHHCVKWSCLNYMSMDMAFNDKLIKRMSKTLFEKDYRPKLYYSALRASYGSKRGKNLFKK